MNRVTFRLSKQHIEDLDDLVEQGEFVNRSEAIRDAIRDLLDEYSEPDVPQRPWAKV